MADFVTLNNGMPQASGSIAQKLLMHNFNVEALRINSVLRKDEYKEMDTAVLDVALDRLNVVQDVISRGLVYNVSNGLGKTVLEYEDVDDVDGASISMSPNIAGQNDALNYELKYLPLPIIHKDFQIDIRKLNASRTLGEALDTTLARKASRKVNEKIEELTVRGTGSYTFGGGTIYGLQNHPNRNTVTLSEDWALEATTGEDILQDVIDMKQALIDDNFFGPYMLYVPTNYETKLDGEFKSNSDKSILKRLQEVRGIMDVKISDYLSSSNVILVQMTEDVIRMVNGLNLSTVQWEENGGMLIKFKVMSIMVPQIRADSNDNCGVCHLSA